MRSDLVAMTERVTRTREESADRPPNAALLAHIDDVLTEGYACALAGDSWAVHAERDFQELISDHNTPIRGGSVRALAREHALFQHDLIELRRELAALRGDRRRLFAGSAVRSA